MHRRVLLTVSAALCGAAGLGLEGVLISAAGLALGYGRSSALGLGAFVAGWALGAFAAGRLAWPVRRTLAAAALLAALAGTVVPVAVFRVARDAPGGALATAVGLAALVFAGLPQGAFLPCLARVQSGLAPRASIAWLWAANLFGSVLGAGAIGYIAVAALGRLGAGALAAAVGAAGALVAFAAAGAASAASSPRSNRARSTAPSAPGGLSRLRAGWILGVATAWMIGLEWICLRLCVLWVDSFQASLTAVIAASLCALALGCALFSALPVPWLLGLALAGSAWPLFAEPALAALAGAPAFAVALSLCTPTLAAFGALVPALHAVVPGESGARLGDLFLHEAWGALLAGPLVHWVLVPRAGLGGAVAWLALAVVALAPALSRSAPRAALGLAAAGVALALGLARLGEPARASPTLTNPALVVRAFEEDAQFAVAVVDDGLRGERTLLTDRFRAAGTGRDYAYMRVLGHLPLLLHPAPRRVAVVALGTGTTAGAVARHPEPERIDVMEISRAVVAAAPWFEAVNGGALAEGLPGLLDPDDDSGRVVVMLGDGRRSLAEHPSEYDVVTIEPLLPDSPFGVYLFTEEFYAVARRALAPGGLVCQWVPPHALTPESFSAVVAAFEASFPWSSLWLFGTQLILVGGEARPSFDPARFPAAGSELEGALLALGLERPEGLLARWIAETPGSGEHTGRVRRLLDSDPWIVFRPRARGPAVLALLPTNLAALAERSQPPPAAWLNALGPAAGAAEERWREHAALREARRVLARAELELRRGETTSRALRSEVEAALRPAMRGLVQDPEVAALLEELDFVASLRAGFAGLAGPGAPDRETVEHLLHAAELRPERADAHLYFATAMQRAGSDEVARAALERALELCPRALETPAGERALERGLRAH